MAGSSVVGDAVGGSVVSAVSSSDELEAVGSSGSMVVSVSSLSPALPL